MTTRLAWHGAVYVIPLRWTVWTIDGVAFRRVGDGIETHVAGQWRPLTAFDSSRLIA